MSNFIALLGEGKNLCLKNQTLFFILIYFRWESEYLDKMKKKTDKHLEPVEKKKKKIV